MRFAALGRIAWFVALAALAGCAGTDGLAAALGFKRDTFGSCGSPPPVVSPHLFFAYPGSGATGVPTSVGRLIFSGFAGGATVQLSSGAGAVQTGTLTPAPSPLPSPLATPSPPSSGTLPYYAVSVPQLAPATVYNVAYSFAEWSNTPPCTQNVTVQLGSFTTQ